MTMITDINDAGAGAQVITARGGLMQLVLVGTWDSAVVTLERKITDTTWQPVKEWSDDAYPIVETVGSAQYRFSTALNAGSPSLKCDVTFDSPGGGSIE